MNISQTIAKTLKKLGVDTVFSVTGGGAMYLNDAMASEFNVIYCHHEQACAIAAEGYFRASGKVACVNVTTGPGGLNTLTGVMGQWTDSIPVIYISGQVNFDTTINAYDNINLRQMGDQEVDIIPIVRPLTKYAHQIREADRTCIPFVVKKAYYEAVSNRMGPVWIDVPMNLQRAQTVDMAQSIYNDLKNAKSPLIIAGHGIRLSDSIELFHKFINRYKIPVVTTFNGFDLLPTNHPLNVGTIGSVGRRAGNIALQNADTVLILGSRNNIRQVSYKWQNFLKNAVNIFIVDIDGEELKKPTITSRSIPLEMDVGEFLENMMDFPEFDTPRWTAWCQEKRNKYEYKRDTPSNLDLYSVFNAITDVLPPESTAVCANGSACVGMFQSGVVKEKSRFFWNSGCAGMGYDLPAAIGAYIATKKPVYCFAGDGSMQMNIQELQTIVHHNMDIKIFYLNNNGYTSIKQTQDNYFDKRCGCDPKSGVSFPNIENLADAYDIPYINFASYFALQDVDNLIGIIEAAGPMIIEINLPEEYAFQPKLKAEQDAQGNLIAPSLENMWPFLTEDELSSNMYQGEKE